MRTVEKDIADLLRQKDPAWRKLEEKRNELYGQIEPLIEKYWNQVPTVELSQCPYCQQRLSRLFDPVDLNGFWWMDRTQRPRPEPEHCPHFCLLMGAVNLNNLPPAGGLFECLPGPDAPFVIPRILELPTMEAVVSCFKMHCGYNAYPIAYFAQRPPAQKDLTQSWTKKEFWFTDDKNHQGWDIKKESYQYNFASWIKAGKLRWHSEGRLNHPGDDPQACPFLNVQGILRPQVLIDNQLTFR